MLWQGQIYCDSRDGEAIDDLHVLRWSFLNVVALSLSSRTNLVMSRLMDVFCAEGADQQTTFPAERGIR